MRPDPSAVALRRFGLGPRPGDVARIAGDPRGYLAAQLVVPGAATISGASLPPSHEIIVAAREAQAAQRQLKAESKPTSPGDATPAPQPMAQPAASERPGRIRRDAFLEDAAARFAHARATSEPLVERLVMFWSNHFAVSIAKGEVRGIAGGFEREAIRPHVLGRFADMLKAVEQHPAMLIYLDQAQSVGPNSKAGNRRAKGLNENLAREILELHTLGVDGGYGQEDVTSLARLLTGWTVGGLQQDEAAAGRFVFLAQRHEPGASTVAGKTYPAGGLGAGEACLADLARHPSTARHVARKLAAHFVSSAPPADLVAELERTFRETDGDLRAVAGALVAAPACWDRPFLKITAPYEYAVALARGLDLAAPAGEMLRLSQALGQPLWQPPGPKGWPDADDAWLGPSPIRERMRIAEKAARIVPKGLDPRAAAADLMGAGLSPATAEAVKRAETREQGFVLLAMSPEFQRR